LVSLVAALGLSIPGSPIIESWVASTQNWIYSRFADWDTRNPPSPDYVIVSDYYNEQMFEPSPRSQPEETSSPAQTADAAIVAENSREDVPTAVREELPSEPVRTVSFVRTRPAYRPTVPDVSTMLSFAEELNRKNEGTESTPPSTKSTADASPRFEPIDVPADLYRGLALDLNRRNEGIGIEPPPAAPRHTAPSFVPLEIVDNLEVDVAYQLNRGNDGIGIRPATPTRPSPAPAPSVTSFGTMESSPSLYFAGEVAPPATVPVSLASPAPASLVETTFETLEASPSLYFAGELTPAVATPGPVASAVPAPPAETKTLVTPEDEYEDLDIELADELTPADDGFATEAMSPTSTIAHVPPTAEPSDVAEDLFAGIGYERIGQTECIPMPAPHVASRGRHETNNPPARPELTRAVRLTRDAVYAWVSVFTGSALVTVSSTH
jgi:hypothetical protein